MKKSDYKHLDTVVVRYAAVPAWGSGALEGEALEPEASADQLAHIDVRARETAERVTLEAQLESSHFRCVLRLGAPDLVRRMEAALGLAGTAAAKKKHATDQVSSPLDPRLSLEEALVLYDYASRLRSRATPFGLCSAVTLSRLGQAGDFSGVPWPQWQRIVRADHLWVVSLQRTLQSEPGIRHSLRYALSASAWEHDHFVRFVSTRIEKGGVTFFGARLPLKPPLRTVLDAFEHAPQKMQSLTLLNARLVEAHGVDAGTAARFLDKLIEAQVLVSELEPPVTGPDALDHLITVLAGLARSPAAHDQVPVAHAALARLEALKVRCKAVAEATADALPAELDGLRSLDQDRGPAREAARESFKPPKVPIQVDCVAPRPRLRQRPDTGVTGAALPPQAATQVVQAVALLHRLGLSSPEPAELASFRQSFAQRYESASVPFLEAIDSELGIGSPLTAGHPATAQHPWLEALPFSFGGAGATKAAVAALPAPLLYRLGACLQSPGTELVLDESDPAVQEALRAQAEQEDAPSLPAAFGAMVTVLASGPDALSRGDYALHLHHASGPGSAKLLGRFAHGAPEIYDHVTEQLRAEEAADPDAAFAEIVHIGQPGHGNVSKRPVLGRLELCVYSRSGAPQSRQVALHEVDLKVRGKGLELWWRPHNIRLVPRLTSAHAYHSPQCDVAYRMLCLLQQQESAMPAWRWGALTALPYLPRVRTGQVILSPARWRLDSHHIATLRQLQPEKATAEAVLTFVTSLRTDLGLPRWVEAGVADRLLTFDLDSPIARRALLRTLIRTGEQTVRERLASPGHQPFYVAGKPHHHEAIFSFVKTKAPEDAARIPPPTTPQVSPRFTWNERLVSPGGPWLYLRLYLGMTDADRLLAETLPPLLAQLREDNLLKRWFFIRYSEHGWHLRLRFQAQTLAAAGDMRGQILDALGAWVKRGVAWRLDEGSYARELERYGGHSGMANAESLFETDADAVVRVLREGLDATARSAWSLACMVFHYDVLLPDPELRRSAVRLSRDAFEREHCGAKTEARRAMRQAIGRRYRELGANLIERAAQLAALAADETSDLLRTSGPSHDVPSMPGAAAFLAWAQAARPGLETYRQRIESGEWPLSAAALARSLVHMHVNRMTRSFQRQTEYVLYEFLDRIALRQRHAANTQAEPGPARAAAAQTDP